MSAIKHTPSIKTLSAIYNQDGKTIQWTVLSESPSSYAAKASVGYIKTVKPEEVAAEMKALLADYNSKSEFCNPDELMKYLNFTPGSVTPLCIMFDT